MMTTIMNSIYPKPSTIVMYENNRNNVKTFPWNERNVRLFPAEKQPSGYRVRNKNTSLSRSS